MADLVGWFEGLAPFVRVEIGGEAVDCLVDTGFDGDVMLPGGMIARLGLPLLFEATCTLADGSDWTTEVYASRAEWMGERVPVEAAASTGDVALLGMRLMRDCSLSVCARDGVVRIARAPGSPGGGS